MFNLLKQHSYIVLSQRIYYLVYYNGCSAICCDYEWAAGAMVFSKGVFSDSSNIIFWHESEDINNNNNNNKIISKISVDFSFMLNSSYAWLCVPIDYCDELSLVNETFCENCSHFLLKWLQPNSLEELRKDEKKNQILKILRVPAIEWFQGRLIGQT